MASAGDIFPCGKLRSFHQQSDGDEIVVPPFFMFSDRQWLMMAVMKEATKSYSLYSARRDSTKITSISC